MSGAVGVLYISYDGVLEPLGQSQVLGYAERLAPGRRFVLISFEKPRDLRDRPRVAALRRRLEAGGIEWRPRRYHKRPSLPATAWDVLAGIIAGVAVCRDRSVRIVHARGYVASAIARCLKPLCGVRFVFDMRGFWPEEKVDAGHWRRGSLVYRLAKRWERRFFEDADAIVSLTHTGVETFAALGYAPRPGVPVVVIPTCADLARFRPGPRREALAASLGLAAAPVVIGCVGTLSNWYLRTETLAYLGLLARHLAGSRILFVTHEDHAALRRDAQAAGVPPDRMVCVRASFDEMPDYLRLMRLGVFFIKPCLSKQGSAATKLAEFLGIGIPIVINDGVGDSGSIVRARGTGVVLDELSGAAFAASLAAVDQMLADADCGARCRATAQALFDVEAGSRLYAQLYDAMTLRRGRVEGAAQAVANDLVGATTDTRI